ncbi:zf-TFIIB domain-containing protein [Paraburkholderia sediminicola]|uniref:TFIIB-type zinc ribbon-containing protein n=1 Tax=Paraburkholderia TaxID=1822464 RepID=UPI0038B8C488
MKCPVCKTTDLLMTERRSIEIDYCPVCRGIWLDRGELDKLIAQDAGSDDTQANAAARTSRDGHQDRDRERHRDHAYDNNRTYDNHRTDYRGHKKKRSLFDMFDFD